MRKSVVLFLMLISGLPSALRAEDGDPVLAAIRAEARTVSPLDHAVSREITDNSGETRQRLERFDPQRPPGERWSLIARNGEVPSPKYREKAEAELKGVRPQAYSLAERLLGGSVRLLDEAEGLRRYEIAQLGPGSILIGGEDISGHIAGIAHVDVSGSRPLLREIALHVTSPFRPRWFAQIESGEGSIRFGRDESGRPVILSYALHVIGARPFGRIDYRVAMRYFDHRHAGPETPDPSGDGPQR